MQVVADASTQSKSYNLHFYELCQGWLGDTFGSVGIFKKSERDEFNYILLVVVPIV